jgi:hypothetical protein
MAHERPPGFADRLPRVVPKEEAEIAQLSDEMAELLYPGRRPRPFRIGLEFESFGADGYERALALARQSPTYAERSGSRGVVHQAAFDVSAARTLRELFELVRGRPGTELLVDGKKVPYAHELWLPLVWIFLGAEA